MRDSNADILGRLAAETWVNHAEMTLNVVLLDTKTDERYYFVFGSDTPSIRAVMFARASLAYQWRPQ
ncbi:hypothetical protein [Aeromonas phage phiA014S]|uniref:Uncharacterized protein n=1 Tax=Aeromonas phage phiA014S TaxID=3119845 RepID=A0ABZ2CMB9_9CAUD